MRRKIAILILTLICTAFATAQTISLEEVRTLALLNSRTLLKANLNLQNLALTDKSRNYTYLPSLSLGASASMNLWNTNGSPPVSNPFDTFNAGASASISESITFQSGRGLIDKAINEITSESARKDAQAEYFNVLDSVDSAYYAVLEAMATLEAEEQSLVSSIASLTMAEIRQSSGMLSAGDYLKALADKESRENSRNQARRSLNLAITKLKALTGQSQMPEPEQIDFSGYSSLINRLGSIPDDEADLIYGNFLNLVFQSNPSYIKAGLADQRAEKNLTMAKLGFAPTLSASFSTGMNYTLKNGFELSAGRLALTLNIPMDFWALANNVEKSQISRESAALDFISTEIQLATDVQSAMINIIGNAESVLSGRRSLEYAEKHYEYVMERYRLSQSSVTELGDASSVLISSRNSLIRAQYGFLQSLSRLRSLAAIADEERLVDLLMGK